MTAEKDPAEEHRRWGRLAAIIVQSANAVMISLGVHAGVLFLISFIPVSLQKTHPKTVMVIQQYDDFLKELELPEISLFKPSDALVEVAGTSQEDVAEKLTEEVQIAAALPEVEVADQADLSVLEGLAAGLDSADGAPPAILALSENPKLASSSLPYGYRARHSGTSRASALKKHGGTGTMASVERSLQWLAHHQESNGSWNAKKYEGAEEHLVATTAAALLAFLGAGYNEQIKPYKSTVRRGLQFLNEQVAAQTPPHFGNNYGSALALMALAESSIFGSSSATTHNANKIAQMFLDQHKGEGWIYDGGGFDFSVSGWVALGLKSAQAADLEAMRSKRAFEVFDQYKKWVRTMSSEETGVARYRPGKNESAHMTWVGMFQRQFLGFPKNDAFLTKAADNSLKWIEDKTWIGGEKPGDVYGIYYGTLAAFQHQGVFWKTWNSRMKKTLLDSQIKGDPRRLGGSWDLTEGNVGKQGGRVMTTALMSLCLEVYYRYELMN